MSTSTRPKSSALARRLALRLINGGHLDGEKYPAERCFIDRTYATWAQRSEGAWAWALGYLDADGQVIEGPPFGSHVSLTVVLSWKDWHVEGPKIERGTPAPGDNHQNLQETA